MMEFSRDSRSPMGSPDSSPTLLPSYAPESDGTALRFAWIVLFVIPLWLLLYRASDDAVPASTLWTLYAAVSAVEALRTRLLRRKPDHPAHLVFPFFDALALSLAVRWTGGISSELWLLYPFQLVAGAFDPNPRTIRVLGAL